MSVIVCSPVVPTLIATTFFEPRIPSAMEVEEVGAAEAIDMAPAHPSARQM